MPRRVLIIGLGLIGGSAGIALRGRGWRVGYHDPNVTLAEAAGAGAADEVAIEKPDVVLLATPVDQAVALMQGSSLPGATIVTSACSVMRPLRRVARENFVAGHPLAGSHLRGLSAASGDLFEGKPWFLDAENAAVDELVRDCGAVIERVSAEEHDAAVALTSHLPQILSTALAASLHEREDLQRFAGSGLKTFLRLAASDASVWAPIIEANRDNLAPHAELITRIVREIIEGDPRPVFEKAQEAWRELEEKSR
jgi:prephenate dehydrogenase